MQSNTKPNMAEQATLILNAVLNSVFNCCSSPSNSAVYFITPVLIAPLANVKAMVIKLENCPISAIPAGPVNKATTLLATKPEAMRIKVIIAEKKEVFISFKCSD